MLQLQVSGWHMRHQLIIIIVLLDIFTSYMAVPNWLLYVSV